MPTLNYDETISDVINNDENWEDEVYGLLDPDEDEVTAQMSSIRIEDYVDVDEIVGEALDDEGI